jgi:hypothetical protein
VSYFQSRLGAGFSIAGSAIFLTLSGVQASENPQVFSLVFQGPEAPELAQQTVVLERAGDEALAIFIVPSGRNGAGVQYHAVFNN